MQKARLGPGYDREATVWDHCVTYGDSWLTWEADPRHVELAVVELGLQAACPQTSPGGAKLNAPLDHEELTPYWQKAYHSLRIWSGAAAAQGPALGSGSGGIKHMGIKFFWLQQKEKNQELRIKKIRGTVNSADLMTKRLHGKRSTALCDLLNIKHISGRTNSAPKQTIDTDYITDAKRAAMTLVRQAAASETAVSSSSESGEWINGMDCWTSAEWMITVIVTVGILVYLVPT